MTGEDELWSAQKPAELTAGVWASVTRYRVGPFTDIAKTRKEQMFGRKIKSSALYKLRFKY